MTRRDLIGAALASAALAYGKTTFDRSRLSAITDEIGNNREDAIAFAHQYGLKHVEIRNPPGDRREYFALTEAEIKADALRFAKEGLNVSFVNTSLLKFLWPGMERQRARPETPEARERRLATEKARWDRRLDDLRAAIQCAQIMGCDKVRVFTGDRVQEPEALYPRIAETISEMAEIAQKEKVYLCVENEMSQNVGTAGEQAALLEKIPSKWVGLLWDPQNAYGKELAIPDGYNKLPKKRLMNVQAKAYGVMPDSAKREDWAAIMKALDKDDYKGMIGLETHVFDGTLIAAAHKSMEELLRLALENSK